MCITFHRRSLWGRVKGYHLFYNVLQFKWAFGSCLLQYYDLFAILFMLTCLKHIPHRWWHQEMWRQVYTWRCRVLHEHSQLLSSVKILGKNRTCCEQHHETSQWCSVASWRLQTVGDGQWRLTRDISEHALVTAYSKLRSVEEAPHYRRRVLQSLLMKRSHGSPIQQHPSHCKTKYLTNM